MLKQILFGLGLMLCVATVQAKGGGGHSGGSTGAKTVHVDSYTKKDGTVVQSYYRAPPGTATHSNGMVSGYSRSNENTGAAGYSTVGVMPTKSSVMSTAPQCQYKAVMTDDEIATCKAEAHARH